MYQHILVPVDGGSPSTRGRQVAVRLARKQRAQLILTRAVLDSDAAAVVRAPTVPVLLVRARP